MFGNNAEKNHYIAETIAAMQAVTDAQGRKARNAAQENLNAVLKTASKAGWTKGQIRKPAQEIFNAKNNIQTVTTSKPSPSNKKASAEQSRQRLADATRAMTDPSNRTLFGNVKKDVKVEYAAALDDAKKKTRESKRKLQEEMIESVIANLSGDALKAAIRLNDSLGIPTKKAVELGQRYDHIVREVYRDGYSPTIAGRVAESFTAQALLGDPNARSYIEKHGGIPKDVKLTDLPKEVLDSLKNTPDVSRERFK